MTNRELLELAAKAAGLDFNVSRALQWSPLTDDGDALRLAVKLRINVYNPPGKPASASTATVIDGDQYTSYFNEKADDAAASRRAIVRAAAEIGRASL